MPSSARLRGLFSLSLPVPATTQNAFEECRPKAKWDQDTTTGRRLCQELAVPESTLKLKR